MYIKGKPQSKNDSGFFINYCELIVIAGFISAIATFSIRQFSGLNVQNEQQLISTIAEITVQTLINLMAFIGIFIVFWLQAHLGEESKLEPRTKGLKFNQEFFTGFDQVYPLSPLDLTMKAMASRRAHHELMQKHMWKVQDFKRRSYYLLSLIVTISISSYFFLFLRFLDFDFLENGTFMNLKLIFSIFIIVLCIRTLFLVFQFITSVIQG